MKAPIYILGFLVLLTSNSAMAINDFELSQSIASNYEEYTVKYRQILIPRLIKIRKNQDIQNRVTQAKAAIEEYDNLFQNRTAGAGDYLNESEKMEKTSLLSILSKAEAGLESKKLEKKKKKIGIAVNSILASMLNSLASRAHGFEKEAAVWKKRAAYQENQLEGKDYKLDKLTTELSSIASFQALAWSSVLNGTFSGTRYLAGKKSLELLVK